MADSLSDLPSAPGALVLNHGDPAYRFGRQSKLPISSAEDVFLRIISYLPFAETVIVPGRHLLDGQSAFDAAVMAKPLLRQGLLVPERRSGPASFDDVARIRKLGALEHSRADFLDQNSKNVREFRWDALSAAYRTTLLSDLAPNGGFRSIVPGGKRGHLKSGLDAAYEIYAKTETVTPEGFVFAVEQACPEAAPLARRWAMAHYYLTPTRFDNTNIRQIPKEAADLLIKGRAIDGALRPIDDLAPAEHLAQELSVGLQIDQVRRHADAYCEAALRVRDDIPQARELFKKIVSNSEAHDIGADISAAMTKELSKQLRKRLIDNPWYSVGVDLVGGALAGAAGLFITPIAAAGLSVAGAGATSGIKHLVKRAFDEERRPWKLAIDSLNSTVQKELVKQPA